MRQTTLINTLKQSTKRRRYCRFLTGLAIVFRMFLNNSYAQEAPDDCYVYIDQITMEGNRKTNNRLILRELEFKVGDSILVSALSPSLERNSFRLLNLGLFTAAGINIRNWDGQNRLHLHIVLTETWFLIPVPEFSLADRNFNVWWTEFKRSLKRVNYGIDLTHNNLSGWADELKLKYISGYSNKYELSYRFPPLDRRQNLYLHLNLSYNRQREIPYITERNKLVFQKNPEIWNITQYQALARVTWRPKLLRTHTFALEYHNHAVSDSVGRELNPDFFLGASLKQQHFSFVYTLRFDYRDIQPYPLHGYLWVLEFRQNGLLPGDDLFLSRLFVEYARFFELHPRLYADLSVRSRASLPRRQPPYFNNQALGYGGNFVRGYEFYVSDGLDFAVFKSALHISLLERTFDLKKLMPFKAFRIMPIKLYLSLNADIGASNDPYYTNANPLVNRPLLGYGLGLDLVAWYNKTARFEYSWNDLGQSGLFIRFDAGF